MSRDDWYRTSRWEPDDQADFETRLRRARIASRPQYLRIKGLALEDAGNDEAAEQLWLRTLEEYPEDMEAVSVPEHLGDMAVRQGRLHDAERLYRRVFKEVPGGSGTSGLVFLSLAELLTATGRPGEALPLLDTADMELLSTFTSSLFRWHVAHANAALAAGDHATACADAAHALWLAEQPSQYKGHQGVGVVTPDETLLLHLRRLAGNDLEGQVPTCPRGTEGRCRYTSPRHRR